MKLDQDQRNEIVEKDPEAQRLITKLWSDLNSGKIKTDRATRLYANIVGNAIQRWEAKREHEGQPACLV